MVNFPPSSLLIHWQHLSYGLTLSFYQCFLPLSSRTHFLVLLLLSLLCWLLLASPTLNVRVPQGSSVLKPSVFPLSAGGSHPRLQALKYLYIQMLWKHTFMCPPQASSLNSKSDFPATYSTSLLACLRGPLNEPMLRGITVSESSLMKKLPLPTVISVSTNDNAIFWFSQAKNLAVILEALLYRTSHIQSTHQQFLSVLSLGYIKIRPLLTLHLLPVW